MNMLKKKKNKYLMIHRRQYFRDKNEMGETILNFALSCDFRLFKRGENNFSNL